MQIKPNVKPYLKILWNILNGEVLNSDMVLGCEGGKGFFFDMVWAKRLDENYLNILNAFRSMEAVFILHLRVDIDHMQYMRSALSYCYGMYDVDEATVKLRTGVYHEWYDAYLLFVQSHHAPDFAP